MSYTPKTDIPENTSLSWIERLKRGLSKTRARFDRLTGVDNGSLIEHIEETLLASDAGIDATQFLLAKFRERVRGAIDPERGRIVLRELLTELLLPLERSLDIGRAKPFVIMIAGVNGAGKTTSIGKLAHHFQTSGHSVMLAAGDTFRAAAREQLVAWGERNGIPVISQPGGDPGAVVFDAVQAARARGIDIVLADTAGRLPTQLHLMDELKKIKRVIAKAEVGAPHEVWLVLDANTGQSALNQVKAFDDALGLTGLILTKLDGTAKGGIVCAIARQRPVPLRFIGVGEGIDDLHPFAAREFISALINEGQTL